MKLNSAAKQNTVPQNAPFSARRETATSLQAEEHYEAPSLLLESIGKSYLHEGHVEDVSLLVRAYVQPVPLSHPEPLECGVIEGVEHHVRLQPVVQREPPGIPALALELSGSERLADRPSGGLDSTLLFGVGTTTTTAVNNPATTAACQGLKRRERGRRRRRRRRRHSAGADPVSAVMRGPAFNASGINGQRLPRSHRRLAQDAAAALAQPKTVRAHRACCPPAEATAAAAPTSSPWHDERRQRADGAASAAAAAGVPPCEQRRRWRLEGTTAGHADENTDLRTAEARDTGPGRGDENLARDLCFDQTFKKHELVDPARRRVQALCEFFCIGQGGKGSRRG